MGINSERQVTNKSFKAKMSEILSVLSGETYAPTPAANDGETLNCKTFEYFMNELKENIGGGGGGSSLPAVTSDDNGDVLQVIEGAWAKGPAPAADNDFLIVGTMDGEGNITSETSISDILAADTAGKNIKLRLVTTGGDETDIVYGQILVILNSDGSEPAAEFISYINGTASLAGGLTLIECNQYGWVAAPAV